MVCKIPPGLVYWWGSHSKCSLCAEMREQSLQRFWGNAEYMWLCQSRQSCSDNPTGSLRFLCPSHSRTFLAGGARPAWEALAAPVPLQPIVTNAIVTGTFCRETQTQTPLSHQPGSPAQCCCHFTARSLANPTRQTAIKKMSQEYQKKTSQEQQLWIPLPEEPICLC